MSVKFFGFGSIRESRIGNGESLEQEQRRLSDSRFPSPDSQLVGAHNRNRTCDLFLTKEVLYRLSYVSMVDMFNGAGSMERETGIEPAPSAWKAEVLPLNYSRIGVASGGVFGSVA